MLYKRQGPAALASTLSLVAMLIGCASGSDTPTQDQAVGSTSNPPYSSEAMEAAYLARFAALTDRSSKNGLGRYDPLKPVAAAPALSAMPESAGRLDNRPKVSAAALSEMRAYAAANNSSAFIVWLDGRVIEETYFEDFDRQSLIVSKSLAKPLAAIAVGRAIQAGNIESLDQSASDYLGEWRDTPKASITIRHLLGNLSGLLPQDQSSGPQDVLSRAYLHPAHDDVIINEYPLVDEPGTRYEYSNANAELIAPIIKRATGVAYDDWVSNEVLSRIGAPGGEVWMNRRGGTAHSGCCILLPAQSYLRMALLLLNDGVWEGSRILPEGYLAEMLSTTEQNPNAGLGLYLGSPYTARRGALNPEKPIGQTLHSEPYLRDDLFLFDGNSNQVVYIIPSARAVIMRTGNWPEKDPEWDNARLPNLLLRDLANTAN